ncbi:MarR family winged helix-turn-helix transcriptional regulator [Nocardia salmonicida]|uniref:MarR family winged helix-turn-helix transcriptional regulator n=1 Tax=Nocardia salmonicida TaxID=53431 RepID=UPI003688C0C4
MTSEYQTWVCRVAGSQRRGRVADGEQHHEQLQRSLGLPAVDERSERERADDDGQRVTGDEITGGGHRDARVGCHRREQPRDDEFGESDAEAPERESDETEWHVNASFRQEPITRVRNLVNRLEDRGFLVRVLCADDRRGIYTELTETGRAAYEKAKPTHDRALETALADAEQIPELAPLIGFLHGVPARG